MADERGAVTLRAATLDDEAALGRLDQLTWSWLSSPAPSPTRPFFNGDSAEGVIVAELDGDVVGYVKLRPPTELASNAHVLAIHGLAVDPAVQGRGIGRRLLEAADDVAVARGVRRLTLRVFGPNAAARRLYKKHGYVVEGVQRAEFRVPAGPDGALVDIDDVMMAKTLV